MQNSYKSKTRSTHISRILYYLDNNNCGVYSSHLSFTYISFNLSHTVLGRDSLPFFLSVPGETHPVLPGVPDAAVEGGGAPQLDGEVGGERGVEHRDLVGRG